MSDSESSTAKGQSQNRNDLGNINKEQLELTLSDINFEHHLGNGSVLTCDNENEMFKNHPFYLNDATLAQFACLIYQLGGTPKVEVPNGWKLLTTAKNKKDDYFGALYWNSTANQLIVAHRGTKVTELGSVKADIDGVIRCRFTAQMTSAAAVAQLVLSVREKLGANFSVSFTGHSLGSWLAQVCAYYAAENGLHAHTVVFDSPGAREMLEKMQPNLDSSINLDQLDITTYLSLPNIINTCNHHVGTAYQIFPDLKHTFGEFSFKNIIGFFQYTSDAHAMLSIRDVFTGKSAVADRLLVTAWPCIDWLDKDNRAGLISSTKNTLSTMGKIIFWPAKKAAKMISSEKTKGTVSVIINAPSVITDFVFKVDKAQYQKYFEIAGIKNRDTANLNFAEQFSLRFEGNYKTSPFDESKIKLHFFDKREIKFLRKYEILRDYIGISEMLCTKLHQFLTQENLRCVTDVLGSYAIDDIWLNCKNDLCTANFFGQYVKQLLRYWPTLLDLVSEVLNLEDAIQAAVKKLNTADRYELALKLGKLDEKFCLDNTGKIVQESVLVQSGAEFESVEIEGKTVSATDFYAEAPQAAKLLLKATFIADDVKGGDVRVENSSVLAEKMVVKIPDDVKGPVSVELSASAVGKNFKGRKLVFKGGSVKSSGLRIVSNAQVASESPFSVTNPARNVCTARPELDGRDGPAPGQRSNTLTSQGLNYGVTRGTRKKGDGKEGDNF